MFLSYVFISCKVCDDNRIWNIAAGPDYSLFLVDGEDFQPSLYYSGREEKEEDDVSSENNCLKSPTLLLNCSKVCITFWLIS